MSTGPDGEGHKHDNDTRLLGRIVVLGLIAAYAIAFILKNRQTVHVHFVFFTASVSLIWLILLSLLLGLGGGVLLSQLYRRRRAGKT